MYRICTLLFLLGSQIAVADELTIPNTFQEGTPARAAEVNDNFTAVEVSVDDNAQVITNVSQNVDTNTQNISSNGQDINAVAQSVSSLVAPSTFDFVGFSSTQLNGGAGLFGMSVACQADFGPDSRMATSLEIVESTSQPTLAPSYAWVRPANVTAVPVGNTYVLIDYSGAASSTGLNCNAWSTGGGNTGLTVLPNGGFRSRPCDQIYPAACSVSQ